MCFLSVTNYFVTKRLDSVSAVLKEPSICSPFRPIRSEGAANAIQISISFPAIEHIRQDFVCVRGRAQALEHTNSDTRLCVCV